jgi:hypothetical protein
MGDERGTALNGNSGNEIWRAEGWSGGLDPIYKVTNERTESNSRDEEVTVVPSTAQLDSVRAGDWFEMHRLLPEAPRHILDRAGGGPGDQWIVRFGDLQMAVAVQEGKATRVYVSPTGEGTDLEVFLGDWLSLDSRGQGRWQIKMSDTVLEVTEAPGDRAEVRLLGGEWPD